MVEFTISNSGQRHAGMVTGVGWSAVNELFSVGDDKKVQAWDNNGEFKSQVCGLDTYVTDFQWIPSSNSFNSQSFSVACSNGSFMLVGKNGRIEKKVLNAHKGSVLACKWNNDGSAFLTVGEDGFVKKWSRSGNLQSKLAQAPNAVYAICWSPDNESILFSFNSLLSVKPLTPRSKEVKWRAHDGLVLALDWNSSTNLIVSGSEDCKYKIWDHYGRLIYQSREYDFPMTSVRWAPSGSLFAVGSYDQIMLCDRNGWVHCTKSDLSSGSIMDLSWTIDGTQFAAGAATGAVYCGNLMGHVQHWKQLEVRLADSRQIIVRDLLASENMQLDDPSTSSPFQDSKEFKEDEVELEFAEKVINMSLMHDRLIVCTARSCSIYSGASWNLPHKIDIQGMVTSIIQTKKHFLLVSHAKGMQIFSAEGTLVSSPPNTQGADNFWLHRFKAIKAKASLLNSRNLAMSTDQLAIIDRLNPNQVDILDIRTGKGISHIEHQINLLEVGLNQFGRSSDRKLAFLDTNRDLYIADLQEAKPVKLATMVDSFTWHAESDMLAAVADSQLTIWYYPNAISVHKDLLAKTKISTNASAFGKSAQLLSFCDSRVTIRRADGALQTAYVLPFPRMLYEFAEKGKWSQCTKLCRLVKKEVLWACLAAMSISKNQLETAAISLAAIDEVDKLEYIHNIMSIPSEEGRRAELFLFKRKPDAAEKVLLSAKLIYRAIKLNISLYRWKRALRLALHHRTHIDTVLAYRERFLQAFHRTENDKDFIKCSSQAGNIDWKTIRDKERDSLEKEKERALRNNVHQYTLDVAPLGANLSEDELDMDESLDANYRSDQKSPTAYKPEPTYASPGGDGGGGGGGSGSGGGGGGDSGSGEDPTKQEPSPEQTSFSTNQRSDSTRLPDMDDDAEEGQGQQDSNNENGEGDSGGGDDEWGRGMGGG